MAKSSKNFKIDSAHVTLFENSSAEAETNLINMYYIYNSFFNEAENFDSLKTFFIGRTGVGKSAIIHNLIAKQKNLKEGNRAEIIQINPEDFFFDIFERSEVIKQLTNFGFNLSLLYKTIWQTIFISEILKKVYGNKKKNYLERALFMWGNESRAYKFLEKNNELDGNIPVSDKVVALVKRMEHSVELDLKLKDMGLKYEGKLPPDLTQKINTSLQKMEVAELRYFVNNLSSEIIGSKKIYIFIDDIDKNWIGNEISRKLISSLFDAILNFSNIENLKIIISLRSNLFDQIELHQPEKYNPYILQMRWTEEEILRICRRRIERIFLLDNDAGLFKRIFPAKIVSDNSKEFSFEQYLISRTNLRPRDAIHFLGFMFRESINSTTVKARDINAAEEHYSIDRLNALFNEWSNPYVGIEFLKDYFSFTAHKISKEDFFGILDLIFDFVSNKHADPAFIQKWLVAEKMIDLDKIEHNKLIDFLFKIGLVGIKASSGSEVRYSYNTTIPSIVGIICDESKFYINPCYYKALNTKFYN